MLIRAKTNDELDELLRVHGKGSAKSVGYVERAASFHAFRPVWDCLWAIDCDCESSVFRCLCGRVRRSGHRRCEDLCLRFRGSHGECGLALCTGSIFLLSALWTCHLPETRFGCPVEAACDHPESSSLFCRLTCFCGGRHDSVSICIRWPSVRVCRSGSTCRQPLGRLFVSRACWRLNWLFGRVKLTGFLDSQLGVAELLPVQRLHSRCSRLRELEGDEGVVSLHVDVKNCAVGFEKLLQLVACGATLNTRNVDLHELFVVVVPRPRPVGPTARTSAVATVTTARPRAVVAGTRVLRSARRPSLASSSPVFVVVTLLDMLGVDRFVRRLRVKRHAVETALKLVVFVLRLCIQRVLWRFRL